MFQLADLLEGVSVDCAELSSESCSPGMNNLIVTCRILFKQCCICSHQWKQHCVYSQTLFSLFFVKINQYNLLGYTENKVCPPDSDEDLGKLGNKDMLKQVGHLSSFLCLLLLCLLWIFLPFIFTSCLYPRCWNPGPKFVWIGTATV